MEVRNLLKTLDRYPPCLLRLIARKGHGRTPMTNALLSQSSGLSVRTIANLSCKNSWRDVTVGTAAQFCLACGCDILHPRRINDYMKRSGFIHLRKDKRYERLLSRILDNINESREHSTPIHQPEEDSLSDRKDR
jgi:hypothetical protein